MDDTRRMTLTLPREICEEIDVRAEREGRTKSAVTMRALNHQFFGHREAEKRLITFLEEQREDPPEFFRAATIARAIEMDPAAVGRLVQQVFDVAPVQRRGYPSAAIYDQLPGDSERYRAEPPPTYIKGN